MLISFEFLAYSRFASQKPISVITMTKRIASENEIQSGDRTHTQLHSITWHNFNTMKTKVSSPLNPTPPEAVAVAFDSLIILRFCKDTI